MASVPTTPSQARAVAIADLFAALDNVLRSYRAIPEDEREERWAADADRRRAATSLLRPEQNLAPGSNRRTASAGTGTKAAQVAPLQRR